LRGEFGKLVWSCLVASALGGKTLPAPREPASTFRKTDLDDKKQAKLLQINRVRFVSTSTDEMYCAPEKCS
jgi:hypothetical protein